MPDITNPFFTEVARGAEDKADTNGYSLILCNTEEDDHKEVEYFERLQSKMVVGYLMSVARNRADHIVVINKKAPIVLLDRKVKGVEADTVAIDNFAAGYMGAKHLIGFGHKMIGLIAGRKNILPGKERLQGYKKALTESRIPVKTELIKCGQFTEAGGYNATLDFLSMKPVPTALFSCNNVMTVGVLTALKEKKIAVPDEISLIGIDDLKLAPFLCPPLTVVTQPGYNMGAIALELLIQRIEQRTSVDVQEVILKPRLIVRESCRSVQ